MSRRILTCFGLAAGLTLGAGPAIASGFLVARFGGEQGHPTSSHPTVIYYNPAGIALGSGTRIYVEGMFAYRSASYERPAAAIDHRLEEGEASAGTPPDAVSANAGKATLLNPAAVPFAAVVSDLGVPGLGVGLAFYVPFGGAAIWDQNEEYEGDPTYPGAVDGIARWSTIEGTLRAMYVTAAGAYRIPSAKLTLGASASLVLNSVATIRARNIDGSDDLVNATGAVQEGRSYLDAKGTTFALGAGAIYQPTPELMIGASYNSQPSLGTSKLEGTLTNKFGNTPVSEAPIDFEQALPDVVRLGGSYRVSPDLELRLFGEFVRWSTFTGQCLTDRTEPDRKCALTANGGRDTANGGAGIVQNIARYWDDAFGLRAGASWWLKPAVELYGGLGYDGSAVPDETMDSSLMDMPKITIAVGGRFGLADDKIHLITNYTQVVYFARTVEPRERDADGEPITFDNLSRTPDGAGTYTQSVGALNVGVEYGF